MASRLRELTVKDLPESDRGLVAGEIDAAFRTALASCDAMPGVKKARRVTIEFEVTPKGGDSMRGCDRVDVAVSIRKKTPAAQSSAVEMKVRRKQDKRGRDVFSAEFLPDETQDMFDDAEEEAKKEKQESP